MGRTIVDTPLHVFRMKYVPIEYLVSSYLLTQMWIKALANVGGCGVCHHSDGYFILRVNKLSVKQF